MPILLASLKQVLILEAFIVLALLDQFNNARSEGTREEKYPVRASLESVHGTWLPFVLDDAFSLGSSSVIHQDDGSLEVTEHREGSVEELVGDERSEIFDSESGLVGGELYFQAAAVGHLPVQLFLGLLGVLSVVHLHEGEVLLGVEENV